MQEKKMKGIFCHQAEYIISQNFTLAKVIHKNNTSEHRHINRKERIKNKKQMVN